MKEEEEEEGKGEDTEMIMIMTMTMTLSMTTITTTMATKEKMGTSSVTIHWARHNRNTLSIQSIQIILITQNCLNSRQEMACTMDIPWQMWCVRHRAYTLSHRCNLYNLCNLCRAYSQFNKCNQCQPSKRSKPSTQRPLPPV